VTSEAGKTIGLCNIAVFNRCGEVVQVARDLVYFSFVVRIHGAPLNCESYSGIRARLDTVV
jgi:hypothetical protein